MNTLILQQSLGGKLHSESFPQIAVRVYRTILILGKRCVCLDLYVGSFWGELLWRVWRGEDGVRIRGRGTGGAEDRLLRSFLDGGFNEGLERNGIVIKNWICCVVAMVWVKWESVVVAYGMGLVYFVGFSHGSLSAS